MLEMWALGFGIVWVAVLVASGAALTLERRRRTDWDRAFVRELSTELDPVRR